MKKKKKGFQHRNGICYEIKVSVQILLAGSDLLKSDSGDLTGGAWHHEHQLAEGTFAPQSRVKCGSKGQSLSKVVALFLFKINSDCRCRLQLGTLSPAQREGRATYYQEAAQKALRDPSPGIVQVLSNTRRPLVSQFPPGPEAWAVASRALEVG